MGTGLPVPVLGPQGQPAQLIPVSDGNFSDLASQLTPGQQLRGRVAEILADGKAIVNFRGIFVTAVLKGVELARGEVISVMVKNLGSEPTFQLVRPAPAPAAAPRPIRLDRATDGILRELGLPRDEFHGTLVRLMADYGINPAREAVTAVKDFIARLPAQLDLPVPVAGGKEAAPAVSVSAAPVRDGLQPPGLEIPLPGALGRPIHPGGNPPAQDPAFVQSARRFAAVPSGPAVPDAGASGLRPAIVSGRAVETAVFLYSAGLPSHHEVARAAFEYLFGEPRLPSVLASFAQRAEALRQGPVPGAIAESLARAVNVARRIPVNPERGEVPEQLRALVENLGLSHEARLARAAVADPRSPAPASRETTDVRLETAPSPDSGLARAGETLKAVLLELQSQIDRADLSRLPPAIRESVESLERATGDLLRVIQAQQVGAGVSQDATNFIWVQIPLALGAELRGGEVQVSWRRDRDGKKRDARVPAQMTMRLDTRALGPVNVNMRLLGSSLAVVIGVRDESVRDFMTAELPGLAERLTEGKFQLGRCVCELLEAQDERLARPVAPTSSLDLRA